MAKKTDTNRTTFNSKKTLTTGSSKSSKMAKLLEKYGKFSLPKRGNKIEGKVVQVLPDKILVDFGGKSEGAISGREFVELKDSGMIPQVGETITAVVVNPEDETGAAILSVKTTAADSVWKKLEKIVKTPEEIEAKVKSLAKGGVLVEIQSLRGFIPATFMDPQILEGLEKFIGKKIKVLPIEVNKPANRLICATISKFSKEEVNQFNKKYKTGEKYSGKITAVFPFGTVVAFGEEKVFVPNSELSWEKVKNTPTIFKKDQNVEFIFLGFDKLSNRPQISLRLATLDPFEVITKNYPKGAEIKGTVSRLTDFGVFITLNTGVEGLVHMSKIPPDVKLDVGQLTTCTVESVDSQQRRISLSLVLKAKPIGYR